MKTLVGKLRDESEALKRAWRRTLEAVRLEQAVIEAARAIDDRDEYDPGLHDALSEALEALGDCRTGSRVIGEACHAMNRSYREMHHLAEDVATGRVPLPSEYRDRVLEEAARCVEQHERDYKLYTDWNRQIAKAIRGLKEVPEEGADDAG